MVSLGEHEFTDVSKLTVSDILSFCFGGVQVLVHAKTVSAVCAHFVPQHWRLLVLLLFGTTYWAFQLYGADMRTTCSGVDPDFEPLLFQEYERGGDWECPCAWPRYCWKSDGVVFC